MPQEILDLERFIRYSTSAEYCAVKRLKKVVKLKLRTAKKLYTYKVDPISVEGVVKKLRCKIVEV